MGDMTGRSENVQDTHRSSMVDKRHLEQKSLGPVSGEPGGETDDDINDGELTGRDLMNDDSNAACNEQHQQFNLHDGFKQKY